MGSAFSKQKVRVLVIGLDNSGKTSILSWLRDQKSQNDVAPTVGFNLETFDKYNLNYTFIDMSGQNQYRDMWEQYASSIDGLIFVIDAVDKLRYSIVANEIEVLFSYQNIKDRPIPILFLANKSDQQGAGDPKFFIDALKLTVIKDRPWYIIGSSTKTGDGLEQGFQWLSSKLQIIKKSQNP